MNGAFGNMVEVGPIVVECQQMRSPKSLEIVMDAIEDFAKHLMNSR
jgi:hypothetical protein